MNSLHKVRGLQPKIIYPGHGPIIQGADSALLKIDQYIEHRMKREEQVLAELSKSKGNLFRSSEPFLLSNYNE